MLTQDVEFIARAHLINQITSAMVCSPSSLECYLSVTKVGIQVDITKYAQVIYSNVISFDSVDHIDRMLLANKEIANLIASERRGEK